MAHVGQEFALGPVGRLGPLGRQRQRLFRGPLFGDVVDEAHDVARPFFPIGGLQPGAVKARPGIAQVAHLFHNHDLSRGDHVLVELADAFRALDAELEIILAQHHLARHPEDAFRLAVQQQVAAVGGVLGEQHRRHGVDDGVQERLGVDLRGHVPADGQQAYHLAGRAAGHRCDGRVPPFRPTGAGRTPCPEAADLAACGCLDGAGEGGLVLVGPELAPVPADNGGKLLSVDQGQAMVVDEPDASVDVEQADIVLAGLQHAREQRAFAFDLGDLAGRGNGR